MVLRMRSRRERAKVTAAVVVSEVDLAHSTWAMASSILRLRDMDRLQPILEVFALTGEAAV